jgi:hypothetical protein
MTLFHVTNERNAAAILRDGFRDDAGRYLTDQTFSGVWLSDQPLDANEGAWGDVILAVKFSVPLSALDKWEWIEEGKPFREWLIPADFIAQHAAVSVVEDCKTRRP